MTKNKIFDALIAGRSYSDKYNENVKIADRFVQIKICKKYGWTYQELMNTPLEFYKDIILIENKESQRSDIDLRKGKKDFNNIVVNILKQIKNKL